MSDEGLRDAREHYAMLLEARPRPYVPDDATIARTKRVNGESLEWCDVYDRQLARWERQRLTGAQREEVERLQGVQRELRLVLTQILELADELAQGTIERQLAKSDLQLGLEYVLGSRPPSPTSPRPQHASRPSPTPTPTAAGPGSPTAAPPRCSGRPATAGRCTNYATPA